MNTEAIRTNAERAIAPLKSVDTDFYGGTRTRAGRDLPDYYLVYFLLVDLLGFRCLGKAEKIAWSVPVDLEGQLVHIEHRKMGLGIFSRLGCDSEAAAEEVVRLIRDAARAAGPYFDWRAEEAVKSSRVNVRNRSIEVYGRFEFLLGEYKSKLAEADGESRELTVTRLDGEVSSFRLPDYELLKEVEWLAMSAIESFFSWTEHVFILLAIMQRECRSGEAVKELAGADWRRKFKAALDISDSGVKRHYDKLNVIRDQVRNFVAHGSFGKNGEAFLFHSGVGAVPVLLPNQEGPQSYRFAGKSKGPATSDAISSIESFIEFLRAGPLAPAWVYLDSGMDLVLTQASSGYYSSALDSIESMQELVDEETYFADAYADMDWWMLP